MMTFKRLLLFGFVAGLSGIVLSGCLIPPFRGRPGRVILPPSPRRVARAISPGRVVRAVIRQTPPAPRIEVRKPRRPSIRHQWVSGCWTYSSNRWHWKSGYWNMPPTGKRTYHSGHWKRVSGGHVWVAGYWR